MSTASAPSILDVLKGGRRSAAGWMAQCPGHKDRSASLSIRVTNDGRTLVHCFAGCEFSEIVDALGLKARDLAPPGEAPRARSGRPRSVKEQAIEDVLRAEDRRRERRAPYQAFWHLSDRIRRAHGFAREARRVACALGPSERIWAILEGAALQETFALAADAELDQILNLGRIAE